MADRIGQQLDNYRLTRLLGAGGFGEVYLAEHLYRTTQVAIKILPQLAQDDLHSFLIEARTFRLKHPNIVQVLDFGVEGRTPFIVMEYAPNGTLRQRHPKGTRVLLTTIVSYIKQVASALQYAHDERLVHRDVKPENMLFGVQNQVLLSDFGIATIAHGTASQSVEAMAGTIPYMAPEQIQGQPRSASDQYSLGVVVYQWLCGDYPFHGTLTDVAMQHLTMPPPSLREKVPAISPDVEQVVTTALAKDPRQRFGSVLAFATALEQASQVKRPEPEPAPVVPVSETTDINQSQQPTEMATPVPVIPFSQQVIVDEVSVDTSAQPQTILPSSGKERLRQVEEERHQAEEERARQEKEQAGKLEEERVRKTKETALAATELATPAHQTPPPTELALPSNDQFRWRETVPDSAAARPSNGTAIKPSGNGRKRSRKQTLRMITAVLLVIVVCGGIIFGGIYASNQASIGATNAAIAQANATNIALIDPNVARSNPDPYPPTNGKLTLYDPMNDHSNKGFGWDESTSTDGNKCQFTNAGYDVSSPTIGYMECNANNIDLNNFAFEVQMTINAGNCGGIHFRNAGGLSNYDAQFCQDGSYSLWQENGNGPLANGSTSQIHTGLGQSNIIAVVANGDELDLYVNQQKIAGAKDNSFYHGRITVYAFGSRPNSCDVVYHNAKVWTF